MMYIQVLSDIITRIFDTNTPDAVNLVQEFETIALALKNTCDELRQCVVELTVTNDNANYTSFIQQLNQLFVLIIDYNDI